VLGREAARFDPAIWQRLLFFAVQITHFNA
jgi:hypothetical protein